MKLYFKTLLLSALSAAAFTSCQQSELSDLADVNENNSVNQGLPNDVLVFSSRDNLKEAIDLIKSGCDGKVATRAAVNVYGASDFKSLVESNKEKLYSTLTPEQIAEVENDEDDLEYCPDDSVIADYAFAQLLNEAREIQVADTVYRYFANGVAYTSAENRAELRTIDAEVAQYEPGPQAVQGQNMDATEPFDYNTIGIGGVTFVPYYYGSDVIYSDLQSQGSPLTLKDGTYISGTNVRDVNYNSKGDGGWFHRVWNSIWGKNILAINKISKKKRLRLGLYDQDYIVYANIGIKVKMQKKVVGIWWNCKASELRLGWSAIELKCKMPKPVKTYFPSSEMPGALHEEPKFPDMLRCKFPFKDDEELLFHIPLVDYDVTNKDIVNVLNSGLSIAAKRLPRILKQLFDQTPKNRKGVYAAEDKWIYSIVSPDEISGKDKRKLNKKFYEVLKPFALDFGYAFSGGLFFKGVEFDDVQEVKFGRGVVYAAVEYNGVWHACRITKDK